MLKKIEVTRDHIQKGIRARPACCPVALAIKEQLKPELLDQPFLLLVQDRIAEFREYRDSGRSWYEILPKELPAEARAFVKNFDHYQPVEPFTFELDIPEFCLKGERPNEVLHCDEVGESCGAQPHPGRITSQR